MLEQLGKYRIDSVLGKGAMGTVYKAFDPNIARTVALKTIRKELFGDSQHAELVSRFKNEAQAAGRLMHANIVGVYDYGEDEGSAYIAMEFVEGTPLNTLLAAQTPRDLSHSLGWMRQLLSALEYAHSKGVVHRDIKPANLLITADDKVKVTDFGVARLDSSTLTQTGSMIGTPSYMSPEQFCGELIDGRSDVFSAGIVLYQLLTGERPFSGSATMVMQQILNQTPVAPSTLNLALDPALDAVIARALAKRPAERYPSAQAFLDDLEALLGSTTGTWINAEIDDDRTVLMRPNQPLSSGVSSLPPATLAITDAVETLTPWKLAVMPELESLLSHQIGPLARFLVRKSLNGADDFEAICAALLPHIPSERGREQFASASQSMFQRLNPLTATPEPAPISEPTAIEAPADPTHVTQATAAEIDPGFAHIAERRLAEVIGPIARIIVSRALRATSQRQPFLQRLAESIESEAQRLAFLNSFEPLP
ncbi:serine/threonine protein kinase [Pseudomonas tolaasii]|uniref:serine/threonine-protein kinase n=1 Tax=Pseudomonas tolaasii TaxID=29442 RepID=UPI0015A06E5C|nr:serine/threonine-protein kinase [Pseudomonas tolaasii]NVZ46264.1 serine/threonine protein kinase [Pseudomonas tolaasii]NWA51286.1 serine/threonine protein kinase [Pseudomonas tolaasii]